MWPLSGDELAAICALPFSKEQVEAHAARTFSAVLIGDERDPRPQDVAFAITDPGAALATRAARAGALVVAPSEHRVRLAELSVDAARNVVLVASPLRCLRTLAQHMRARLRCPVVAVAGSNGKTTTKEMTAAVLSGRRSALVTRTPGTNNGWLGIPLTLCHPLHRAEHPPDAVVVEIGIDALGAMEHHLALVQPDIAVIASLGPEHIEGLGTTAQAIREELRAFHVPRVKRVWMADDEVLGPLAASSARDEDVVVAEDRGRAEGESAAKRVMFRVREEELAPETGHGRTRLALTIDDGGGLEIDVPLPGRHNARNAALACGVGIACGLSLDEIRLGFSRFRALEQRCATASLPGDCLLIDDTYNASPNSMRAALDVLAQVPLRERVAVLGDMLELGAESDAHHDAIAAWLLEHGGIDHVFLYGDAMRRVHAALDADRTRFGSLRWCAGKDAPEELLDWSHWDGCAVLVKGSRGMAMERFVRVIASRQTASAPDPVATRQVLVVGAERERLAYALRRAAGRDRGHRVRVMDPAAVLRGEHHGRHVDVLVLAGFRPAAEDAIEAELALLAQPLLTLGRSARVVAFGLSTEAANALREVSPPEVAWVTFDADDDPSSSDLADVLDGAPRR